MKIVFFGSDDFAALHLERLLDAGHEIAACVTGPDKPQGRGMKIAVSPIKEIALKHRIPCLQPLILKDKKIVEDLKAYGVDIFVVVAYGRLLTQEILDIPKFLCMNVHGSLLPRWRGAAPVNWAILNGDKHTGVTIQKMALALDAGDIIAQVKMDIGDDEDAGQLRGRMAQEGAELLVKILKEFPSGKFPLQPQDESKVTLAPKLSKDMGQIDWSKSAQTVFNQVRGLQPWPGAFAFYKGKMLKVSRAQLAVQDFGRAAPGEVLHLDKNGFYVACADGAVLIKEVQPEAGKKMPAVSFVAGYKITQGHLLTP